MSEKPFLPDLWAFWEKKIKNVTKFVSGIFGLFGLQRLPGFQALIVAIFQGIQAKRNIENGNPEGKSQLTQPDWTNLYG